MAERHGATIRIDVDYAAETARIANLDDRTDEAHVLHVTRNQDGYTVTDNAEAEPVTAETFLEAVEHAWSVVSDTVTAELDPSNWEA